MNQLIKAEIEESLAVKKLLTEDNALIDAISKTTKTAVDIFRKGNKLLIAGNGGSAADAQHIAAELLNRMYFDRPSIPAIALTTDTSVLTSIGNDSDFGLVFSRQIEGLGAAGDMFLGISTSGNAENVIKALCTCREKGIITVGMTGENGGKMAELCDICIKVPSKKTPRIQECHILICHILCGLIEEKMFGT